MFRTLMRSRRFAPLFWCQFFSAFNDNFVRQMLAMLILFRFGAADAGAKVSLAVAIFVLPSIPLSPIGGEIADAHDKAAVARKLKFAEIFVQMIAAAGFYFSSLELALSRAVRARLHCRAVRPDQIRHPARSSEARRAGLRQCAGRGRDVRGDHLRPGRRRLRRGGGTRALVGRRAAHGRRRRLLRRLALHSRRPASARPASRSTSTPGARRAQSCASCGRTTANGSARSR